jgi:hypothetical protein
MGDWYDWVDFLRDEDQDLKGWGPEDNDREPYKTQEVEIGQGGLGVTTSRTPGW